MAAGRMMTGYSTPCRAFSESPSSSSRYLRMTFEPGAQPPCFSAWRSSWPARAHSVTRPRRRLWPVRRLAGPARSPIRVRASPTDWVESGVQHDGAGGVHGAVGEVVRAWPGGGPPAAPGADRAKVGAGAVGDLHDPRPGLGGAQVDDESPVGVALGDVPVAQGGQLVLAAGDGEVHRHQRQVTDPGGVVRQGGRDRLHVAHQQGRGGPAAAVFSIARTLASSRARASAATPRGSGRPYSARAVTTTPARCRSSVGVAQLTPPRCRATANDHLPALGPAFRASRKLAP